FPRWWRRLRRVSRLCRRWPPNGHPFDWRNKSVTRPSSQRVETIRLTRARSDAAHSVIRELVFLRLQQFILRSLALGNSRIPRWNHLRKLRTCRCCWCNGFRTALRGGGSLCICRSLVAAISEGEKQQDDNSADQCGGTATHTPWRLGLRVEIQS